MNKNHHDQLLLPFEPELPLQSSEQAEPALTGQHGCIVLSTWNVNSIRARLESVLQWLDIAKPDVLCLQETRVTDAKFPNRAFEERGYHCAVHGTAQRNGVAILSRMQLSNVQLGMDTGPQFSARMVSATIGGVRAVCVYVPNAQSRSHHTFREKVEWLRAFGEHVNREVERHTHVIVCGDFNVAPQDADVYDVSAWICETFIAPEVRSELKTVFEGRLCDLHLLLNGGETAYTWWDYRANSVAKGDGMRLDHIYATSKLASNCRSVTVHMEPRRAKRPSDHAPVVAQFDLSALGNLELS